MELLGLAELERARKKNAATSEDRKKQTEDIYLVGCELLQRCRANQFQDSQMVHSAYDCFSFALENNRTDPRPYVQIAALFLCYHDVLKATEYIKEALRLDPEQPDAKKLWAYAQDKATKDMKGDSGGPAGPLQVFPIEDLVRDTVEIEDYDLLYDEVEYVLNNQLKIAFSQTNHLKPSVDESLLDARHIWQANLAKLENALVLLAEEFELPELEQIYVQLQRNVVVILNILTLSETFIQVKQHLQQLQSEATEMLESNNSTTAQAFLDLAHERLDALADQLDQLEDSGNSIEPVTLYYNQVVETLKQLEEQFRDPQ